MHLQPEFGPGATFGPYTLVRLLGTGGMGSVWEAQHARLQKRVAIKLLHSSVAQNAETVHRFLREGETAAKLRHPNVVDVTDVAVENGVPYLVMEFLDGISFRAKLDNEPRLPIPDAIEILLPIASALATAHEEGVIHRDLKPDNVFLSKTRTGALVPKLLDFGISKVTGPKDPKLTATNTMMGTPFYMSPEQAKGLREIDGRSDQYSFGVILYEALTGRRTCLGESLFEIVHEVTTGTPPAPTELRPELPSALERVMLRLLDKEPTKRYRTMYEVGAALLPFAGAPTRQQWEAMYAGHRTASMEPPEPAARGPSGTPTPTPFSSESMATVRDRPRASTARLIAGSFVAAALTGGVVTWGIIAANEPPPQRVVVPVPLPVRMFSVRTKVQPADATVLLNGRVVGVGGCTLELPQNGVTHQLRVEAEGHEPLEIPFTNEPPPATIALVPLELEAAAGEPVPSPAPPTPDEPPPDPAAPAGEPGGEATAAVDRPGRRPIRRRRTESGESRDEPRMGANMSAIVY